MLTDSKISNVPSRRKQLMATFNASILPLPAVSPAGTAATLGVSAPPGSIGLCLSGGGSRALTCAMGQLRALHTLGLIDQLFAISSVSGGTWANSLYTYLPASISDEDFLGAAVLDPSRLTVTGSLPHALDQLTPNNLGKVPGGLSVLRDIDEILRLKFEWGYPNSELWQGLIGHSVLRAFGLWQPDPKASNFDKHWFSWTDAFLKLPNGTLARNPGLRASDFYTVKRQRPFMIFNTALFTDDSTSADLLPFEANFMLGVRQPFPSGGSPSIGGGFMDSFAMAGSWLKDLPGNRISVAAPARNYTLADIVGSSSAAFAQELEERYTELSGLVPSYAYFPIAEREGVPAKPFRFADGGSLENLGLNVMLARGVARLLVGINTDEGIRQVGNDIVVSSDLPPLFGLQPWVEGKGYVPYSSDSGTGAVRLFRHNQVFPTSSFSALQQALWDKRSKGLPVVVRQRLPVLCNPWYGIPGDTEVDLLWMYNDQVESFWSQLSLEVQLAIDVAGELQFPLYNTFTQLELDAVAVNALAHLWCWNLAADWKADPKSPSNADLVRGMFS
jgi:hypothetical protein